MQMNSEIGRELKASDLVPHKVVVVQPPEQNIYATFWVEEVTADSVVFYASARNWIVMNFVRPDGTIWDDKDRQVHVFEYLGTV